MTTVNCSQDEQKAEASAFTWHWWVSECRHICL